MGAIWLIILASCIKSIPIGLNMLTLYAYYKLHILKKPPGELIFIQLLIFLILQVVTLVIFLQVNISGPIAKCGSTVYISSITLTACILSEICISFEVFKRVRSAPMGQNYKYRRVLYYLISFGGALALMLVKLFNSDCSTEFEITSIDDSISK